MSVDEIISQLESLRENSADMARSPHADEIWQKDVAALEAAIEIIKSVKVEQ